VFGQSFGPGSIYLKKFIKDIPEIGKSGINHWSILVVKKNFQNNEATDAQINK